MKARIAAWRERWAWFDHVMSMQDRYTRTGGNLLAGASTYFGFLSFFPILALAFFVIGYVKQVWPDSEDALVEAINQILPGIVTTADPAPAGKFNLQEVQDAKAVAGVVGVLGVLYSGLGWLSGLRQSLLIALETPAGDKPGFVVGKARDLLALATIGSVLLVSVALAGVVGGLTDDILDLVGLDGVLAAVLLYALTAVLGIAASTVLFYAIYRLLTSTDVPARALLSGALLAAVGFEVLKQLVVGVLGSVGGTPFAPLALSITLLVWINYFSRLVFYGVAWAATHPLAATASVGDGAAVGAWSDGVDDAADRPEGSDEADEVDAEPPAEPEAGRRAADVLRPVAVVGFVVLAAREVVRRFDDPAS